MNKNMVILFFVVALGAAGYYGYQQGYFNSEIAQMEKNLNAMCDPTKEDCTDFENDLIGE